MTDMSVVVGSIGIDRVFILVAEVGKDIAKPGDMVICVVMLSSMEELALSRPEMVAKVKGRDGGSVMKSLSLRFMSPVHSAQGPD
jgi:hypothetical protein